jgi:hypothetical protein
MRTVNAQLREQEAAIFTNETHIVEILGLVDLHPTEAHDQGVDKTDNPVETGASLTDNAVIRPNRLTLSGVVSDLRLYDVSEYATDLPAPELAKDAWGRLKHLKDACEPVTVITSLQVYENMLVTGLSAPVNEKTGHALEFTVTLEEVEFAYTQRVSLPATKVKGARADEVRAREDGKNAATSPAQNKTDTVERGKVQPETASAQRVQDFNSFYGR